MEDLKAIERCLTIGYDFDKDESIRIALATDESIGIGCGSGSGHGDAFPYHRSFDDGKGNGGGYGNGSGGADGKGYGTDIFSRNEDGKGFGCGSGNGGGNECLDKDDSGGSYGCRCDVDPTYYCWGITAINNDNLYDIGDLSILIDCIRKNYAKGRILKADLSTRPCYVARVGHFIALGDTLRQAVNEAQAEYLHNLPLAERIAKFNREFPNREVKVFASGLFLWHHILTGSCLEGRKAFCEEHGLNWKYGFYSVNDFIRLTRDAEGGDIIRILEKTSYKNSPNCQNFSEDFPDGYNPFISNDNEELPF